MPRSLVIGFCTLVIMILTMAALPVVQLAPAIVDSLRRSPRLVLTAPTGSGKTTQLPQLLYRHWLTNQRIIVLQPRRLATRMVAQRVADELGCPLGSIVGYQTRHDSAVSPDTVIRFMTEGLLLRLLRSDPNLRRVGAVVIDEFHERTLAADMALGWVKRLQQTARPDLRLVVMSATLDTRRLAEFLHCPVLHAEGRAFAVDIGYLPKRPTGACWDLAAGALADHLRDHGDEAGDVLIFMPGVYEINRTIEACRRRIGAMPGEVPLLLPLHGSLPPAKQDAAVAPAHRRKVIVATNVAETSITIPGIRCVIDSGLARVHRYLPGRAINVLQVEPISRASADQRAGRAGRTAPGRCVRLWTEADHRQRDEHDTPEVRRVELAEAMLDLRASGVSDMAGFDWLDAPEPRAVQHAADLLRMLGATDQAGGLTDIGRRMARWPVHPRLARMLAAAEQLRCFDRAALWAALIHERDLLTDTSRDAVRSFEDPAAMGGDLLVRQRAYEAAERARFHHGGCAAMRVNALAAREIGRTYAQLRRIGGWHGPAASSPLARAKTPGAPVSSADSAYPCHPASDNEADLLRCLLQAYPDHVAVRLDANRPHCAMAGRRRVMLDRDSVVREAGPLLAVEVRQIDRPAADAADTVLALAVRIDADWLRELFADRCDDHAEPRYNEQAQAVEVVTEHRYAGLVLRQRVDARVDPAVAAPLLAARIADGSLKLSQWDEQVESWIARVRCVAQWFPERGLMTYDRDDLAVIYHDLVEGATRFAQVRDRPCLPAVRQALSWDDQQFVERMAPTHLTLPNGRRMSITYDPAAPPLGRALIQDLYGLNDTPRVAAGRQPVVLEILAPNRRPVQRTDDLPAFWKTLYPELRKELRRRYPKHEWR